MLMMLLLLLLLPPAVFRFVSFRFPSEQYKRREEAKGGKPTRRYWLRPPPPNESSLPPPHSSSSCFVLFSCWWLCLIHAGWSCWLVFVGLAELVGLLSWLVGWSVRSLESKSSLNEIWSGRLASRMDDAVVRARLESWTGADPFRLGGFLPAGYEDLLLKTPPPDDHRILSRPAEQTNAVAQRLRATRRRSRKTTRQKDRSPTTPPSRFGARRAPGG
jgi:hypothetical protein